MTNNLREALEDEPVRAHLDASANELLDWLEAEAGAEHWILKYARLDLQDGRRLLRITLEDKNGVTK